MKNIEGNDTDMENCEKDEEGQRKCNEAQEEDEDESSERS